MSGTEAVPLVVHGLDLSYFTGKLQAYLRATGIPWVHREMDLADLRRCGAVTGILQMPAVEMPDGSWLTDTTPTIRYLESYYATPTVLPVEETARFLALLLEDYADEWLWRPALYYRWAFAADAQLLSRRIAESLVGGPSWLLPFSAFAFRVRQRHVYLNGEGVTRGTRPAVEALYLHTLAALETVFRQRPYLLGARPTIADFGVFGPFFRHFFCDPTPARLMRDQAPAVLEWVARLWNLRPDDWRNAPLPEGIPDGLDPLFATIRQDYLPYLLANDAAVAAGAHQFAYRDAAGIDWSLKSNPYRAHCLDRLKAAFSGLGPGGRAKIDAILGRELVERSLGAPRRQGVPDLLPPLPIRSSPARRPTGRWWR